MFHSNQPKSQIEITLQSLIEELYSYQSKIDLTNGVAHSLKIQRINRVGNASFYTACIWAICSVWIDWSRGYCKNPIIQHTDKFNNIVGETINGITIFNPKVHRVFANREHVGSRLAYDYNNNGIFGEAGETESCQWLQNSQKPILYIFAMMLAIYGICKFYSWNSNRLYKNNLNAKKSYDDLYEIVDEALTKLLENFDALSIEQKEEMVELQLASMDDRNKITLKYICPITRRLIALPVVIETDHHTTVYDVKLLLHLIKLNFNDPSTFRPIKHLGFSQEINDDCRKYLIDIENYINVALKSNLEQENRIVQMK